MWLRVLIVRMATRILQSISFLVCSFSFFIASELTAFLMVSGHRLRSKSSMLGQWNCYLPLRTLLRSRTGRKHHGGKFIKSLIMTCKHLNYSLTKNYVNIFFNCWRVNELTPHRRHIHHTYTSTSWNRRPPRYMIWGLSLNSIIVYVKNS